MQDHQPILYQKSVCTSGITLKRTCSIKGVSSSANYTLITIQYSPLTTHCFLQPGWVDDKKNGRKE